MALQNFVDKVGPVVSAAWLNMVDVLSTTVFGNAGTAPAARTALFTDAPLEVTNGGTGGRDSTSAQNALFTGAPLSVANGGTGLRATLVTALGSDSNSASITTVENYYATKASGPLNIAPLSLAVGSAFLLTTVGLTNCTHTGDTTTLRLRMGSTGTISDPIINSFTYSSVTGASGNCWVIRLFISVRSLGSSGSLLLSYETINTGVVGLTAAAASVSSNITATVDTTQSPLYLGAGLITNAATTTHIVTHWTTQRIA